MVTLGKERNGEATIKVNGKQYQQRIIFLSVLLVVVFTYAIVMTVKFINRDKKTLPAEKMQGKLEAPPGFQPGSLKAPEVKEVRIPSRLDRAHGFDDSGEQAVYK